MDPISRPENLPQFAQDLTVEQREACVVWLASFSLRELRDRQDINRVRMEQAYRSPHTCARGTAESLQVQAEILIEAVTRVFWVNFATTGSTMKKGVPGP